MSFVPHRIGDHAGTVRNGVLVEDRDAAEALERDHQIKSKGDPTMMTLPCSKRFSATAGPETPSAAIIIEVCGGARLAFVFLDDLEGTANDGRVLAFLIVDFEPVDIAGDQVSRPAPRDGQTGAIHRKLHRHGEGFRRRPRCIWRPKLAE